MKSSLPMASLALVVALAAGCSSVATGPTHAREVANAHTLTVFVDATLGFRKDHMASQLTQSHLDQALRGYRFADMEAYTENGDLQGFFVTYVRN